MVGGIKMTHTELYNKVFKVWQNFDNCSDNSEIDKLDNYFKSVIDQMKKEREAIEKGILNEPEYATLEKSGLIADLIDIVEFFESLLSEYEDTQSCIYDRYREYLYYDDCFYNGGLKEYLISNFELLEDSELYIVVFDEIENNLEYYTEEKENTGYWTISDYISSISIDELEESNDYLNNEILKDCNDFKKLSEQSQSEIVELIASQYYFTQVNDYFYYSANVNFYLVPVKEKVTELIQEKKGELKG